MKKIATVIVLVLTVLVFNACTDNTEELENLTYEKETQLIDKDDVVTPGGRD